MVVLIALIVVVGTTIWVGIDSSHLGAERGKLGGGFLDIGTASWVLSCLIVWIVAFPCYLGTRARLVAAQHAGGPPGGFAGSHGPPPYNPGYGPTPYPGPPPGAPYPQPPPYLRFSPPPFPAQPSATTELERLYCLLQNGALTKTEFEGMKQQLLQRP